MIEVVVITEGQTEEAFIKQVIAPSVRPLNIFVKPQLLYTSKDSKGGAVTYDRFKFNARNTIRQNSDRVVTTFLDYYGLDTDFPGFQQCHSKADIYQKVQHLEQELHAAIVNYAGCRSDKFKPYIQPHEFEGLLFSDSTALISTESEWGFYQPQVQNVIDSFVSPEHINDGYETKPSARLKSILRPGYKKTRHGPIIAKNIGLDVIGQKCIHFNSWMNWLRGL